MQMEGYFCTSSTNFLSLLIFLQPLVSTSFYHLFFSWAGLFEHHIDGSAFFSIVFHGISLGPPFSFSWEHVCILTIYYFIGGVSRTEETFFSLMNLQSRQCKNCLKDVGYQKHDRSPASS